MARREREAFRNAWSATRALFQLHRSAPRRIRQTSRPHPAKSLVPLGEAPRGRGAHASPIPAAKERHARSTVKGSPPSPDVPKERIREVDTDVTSTKSGRWRPSDGSRSPAPRWPPDPRIVQGPGADPECFTPWSDGHQVLPVAGQEGPLPHRARQRLRRQHLAHPDDQDGQGLRRDARDVAPQLKEFKVVSTGTDVAAQIAAIDNFINSGYDAIVTIAVNPTAFDAGDQARQRAPAWCSCRSTTSSTPTR